MAQSTSAASGQGWLLLPNVTTEATPVLLDELQGQADLHSVPFDRSRAERFVDETSDAMRWFEQHTDYHFEPVPAFRDPYTTPCAAMLTCCSDHRRDVPNHGSYTCDESKVWFKASGCCENASSTLQAYDSWPAYLHLTHQLHDKVMWVSSAAESNVLILDVMQAMLPSAVRQIVGHAVERIDAEGDTWRLKLASHDILSTKLVFANGGYGAAANEAELRPLSVGSTAHVHAQGNTRILRTLAAERNWAHEDANAWFLEFVDGAPKWFLWDTASTVVDAEGRLVYDESMSYDERGRVRQRQNLSEALLVYEEAGATGTLSEAAWGSVEDGATPKACDTRSKRLWRNYVAETYGDGAVVDTHECSRRVARASSIKTVAIHQGIIDTISGPEVDEHQRVQGEPTVAVCGNAGSPGLIGMYVAPGSTLGNAFVTGYMAGKYV